MTSLFITANRGATLGAVITQDDHEVNLCIQITDSSLKVNQIVIPFGLAIEVVEDLSKMLGENALLASIKKGKNNDPVDTDGGIIRS